MHSNVALDRALAQDLSPNLPEPQPLHAHGSLLEVQVDIQVYPPLGKTPVLLLSVLGWGHAAKPQKPS